MDFNAPVFFERNRVFRVYTGGKLFHGFFEDAEADTNFPEEWIASSVKALNRNSAGTDEGLSVVESGGLTFDKLLSLYPQEMLGKRSNFGILIKILDSAVRLPIQAHPNKEFSQKYFNSNYGKTEMWLVLGMRPCAKIYLGFNRSMTAHEFEERIAACERGDGDVTNMLSEVDVKSGDVYLIPAGLVHAIGSGCLILEVQEPTDFTIQPENKCGDYELNEYEKYLGLPREAALKCFNLELTAKRALQLSRKQPAIISQTDGVTVESLITYSDTPCFAVNRITLSNGAYTLPQGPSVYIAVEGDGTIGYGTIKRRIKKGSYFFLPHAADNIQIFAKNITLIECLPPVE